MPNTNPSHPSLPPTSQNAPTITPAAPQASGVTIKPAVAASKVVGAAATTQTEATAVTLQPNVQTTKLTSTDIEASSQTIRPTSVAGAVNATPQKPVTPQTPAKVLPVKVVIAAKTYTINCPADETAELNAATAYIDDFIQSIRKQAPHLTHENLLVLCCLNLYEQMQASATALATQQQVREQATQLVDKMIKDMTMI